MKQQVAQWRKNKENIVKYCKILVYILVCELSLNGNFKILFY